MIIELLHIRFMPDCSMIRAYPFDHYKTSTKAGAAIILMIMNNLDPRVAQFPEELVTYGGNGQVSVFIFIHFV